MKATKVVKKAMKAMKTMKAPKAQAKKRAQASGHKKKAKKQVMSGKIHS